MDRIFPSHQVKGREKPVKSENMITMKMAKENMVDLTEFYSAFSELHLSSFTTVY
jgi:hypothetical protein